jgi:hypothetical protein
MLTSPPIGEPLAVDASSCNLGAIHIRETESSAVIVPKIKFGTVTMKMRI